MEFNLTPLYPLGAGTLLTVVPTVYHCVALGSNQGWMVIQILRRWVKSALRRKFSCWEWPVRQDSFTAVWPVSDLVWMFSLLIQSHHFKILCAAGGSAGRSERAEDRSSWYWNKLSSLIHPLLNSLIHKAAPLYTVVLMGIPHVY